MINPGTRRNLVTLARKPQTSNDADGFFEDLVPSKAWVAIEPLPPQEDGRRILHLVTMPYHPQVTVDVRLLLGTRELFVRGVQDVGNRHEELRLQCEEIVP